MSSESPVASSPATPLPDGEARLLQLLMESPVAISILRGPEHRFEFANPRYLEMVQKTPSLVGQTMAEAFPEVVGTPLFAVFDDVVRTGKPFYTEEFVTALDRDGSGPTECFFKFNLVATRDSQGVIDGMMCTAVEITDQVKARRRLKTSLDELSTIFERVPAIVGVVSAPEQRYLLANPGLRQLYGNRPLLGRTRREAHPELERSVVPEAIDTVIRTGERFSGKAVPVRIDRTNSGVLEDGFYDVIYQPVKGADGTVQQVVLFAVEVTEQVRSQQRAARSEDALRLLVTTSGAVAQTLELGSVLDELTQVIVPAFADMVLADLIGDDGKVERVAVTHRDPAQQELAEELKAYPPSGDRDRLVSASFLNRESYLVESYTEEMMDDGVSPPRLVELRRALGVHSLLIVPMLVRERQVGVLSFAMTQSGRKFTLADQVLAEDIARRAAAAIDNARLFRLAQRDRKSAEEANRTKDEFLAVVSHELRTPLTSMLGWLQMLRTGSLAADRRDRALETVERNARSQAQLVEDLLDISTIISGKLRLDVELLDLGTLAEAAVESLRPAADAKGIRLSTALSSGSMVRGDPGRLQQVIWNLVSNAIKFSPRGGRVNLVLERSHSSVALTVNDNGKGINASFLPHIFEQFRQADTGSTRKYGGLGLGLSIVKHLVELHGGTVDASSAGEGQGAVFKVQLPAAALREAGPPQLSLATTPEVGAYECPPEIAGLRVLVVDDEADTRELLASMLTRCQVQVTLAGSAAEAMESIEREVPDAVISDIGMPGEDGYQLISRLRKLPVKSGGQTPAIALTAYSRAADRRRALQAGFTMHVPKPIDPAELVVVLASVTAHRPRG